MLKVTSDREKSPKWCECQMQMKGKRSRIAQQQWTGAGGRRKFKLDTFPFVFFTPVQEKKTAAGDHGSTIRRVKKIS
ncbi:hypothetical protein R1flu_026012 [Riccia fluitans]|uniref:Uncharacterized protein n=1 Tax=Riccia fluitans TaxID=41844 RepID=A0ABD1XFB2_9MARC